MSVGRIELGLALVVILYATALLTSIKAKITGNFFLQRFGPTEFKLVTNQSGVTMFAAVELVFDPGILDQPLHRGPGLAGARVLETIPTLNGQCNSDDGNHDRNGSTPEEIFHL